MVCETELLKRKAFMDAIREFDFAPSEERLVARQKMVAARLDFVIHRAGCLLCSPKNHRKSEV
jgi:hypothetical protein